MFYLTCKVFFVFLIGGHILKPGDVTRKYVFLATSIQKAGALEAQACIPT